MSKLPQDNDEPLVEFLRQNRPVPPPAPCDFEDKLMHLVEEKANTSSYCPSSYLPPINPRYYWAFPGIIAASLLFVWNSLRTLTPPQPAVVEVVELESFLVNSWNGVIGEVEPQRVGYLEENSWLVLSNLATDSQSLPPSPSSSIDNLPASNPQPQFHNVQYQTR
ncbi:MAG: hypothetical protein WA865_22350 [Spirulinaceae cyanobacterium]